MSTRLISLAILAALSAAAGTTPALAQTKPMHSGHMSHGAPQMRADGSGLYRPNRPHFHHHQGHPGYRAVYPYAPHSQEASDLGRIF